MTSVVNIRCPECDQTKPIRKVGIDQYRCDECSYEFGHREVLTAD